MGFIEWYLLVTCLILAGGIGSIIYSLPLVADHWRPTYWFGLVAAGTLQAALGGAFLLRIGTDWINPQWIPWILEAALAMLAVLFILVPAIHRWERRARRD